MAENSAIEWTDHTFNPWIGCTVVGPGCVNCYARADFDFRKHFATWGAGQPRRRTSVANWKKPLAWNRKAAAEGRRYRVFCASLADVFDNEVPAEWRADLFALIRETPHLDWLLLTKRIGNTANMLPVPFDFERLYPNVWLGATIVNQTEADRDIPKLLATPARVRFLSMEPLLGPVNVSWALSRSWARIAAGFIERDCFAPGGEKLRGLDWIIVGGESGPGARPMHPDWARSLRDQCVAAGVPFLFKQWGEWAPGGDHLMEDRPEFLRLRTGDRSHTFLPNHQTMARVGKKAAGRLLDGVAHDGAPS